MQSAYSFWGSHLSRLCPNSHYQNVKGVFFITKYVCKWNTWLFPLVTCFTHYLKRNKQKCRKLNGLSFSFLVFIVTIPTSKRSYALVYMGTFIHLRVKEKSRNPEVRKHLKGNGPIGFNHDFERCSTFNILSNPLVVIFHLHGTSHKMQSLKMVARGEIHVTVHAPPPDFTLTPPYALVALCSSDGAWLGTSTVWSVCKYLDLIRYFSTAQKPIKQWDSEQWYSSCTQELKDICGKHSWEWFGGLWPAPNENASLEERPSLGAMAAQLLWLKRNYLVAGNVPGAVLESEPRTGPHSGNNHT